MALPTLPWLARRLYASPMASIGTNTSPSDPLNEFARATRLQPQGAAFADQIFPLVIHDPEGPASCSARQRNVTGACCRRGPDHVGDETQLL